MWGLVLESNENSLNTSQGIESQLSQKQSVNRHSSCLYEPSQTENSQNWCDHQSALPHKTGIRVRHPSNSTNNKNKNSHYQNSSSFISTTTAAFPGSATQDASSLFSSALSSSLPSSRPHSTANYASGAATHTTSQRIPPEATTSTLTLGNREKAAASSSTSVLNADPFSHRQAYCTANPKNNHNPIHSAPLISSAHLAGGRAQRREDGEDGGEGRRVGGLRRVEMAAISTFRAWKRKQRQRENPQQQGDGETPGSAAAASLLLFAPGVSPAACSTYSTPALLLQCLLDFHQRPGGLENLFDDESNPVWSCGKRQREPLSIPSSESFHAPDSSLPTTASKRNDRGMRHHAEQVAQWIIDHLPQLLAARQHRCNIQNTNMTVAAASSTNNNSAPSKENITHFPSSRAGSQHNGESSTSASALDAAALFTADGNIPPKGDLIAPLLVELTRFYLRMGILSNVAAAPDWTTQSSTSHFAATGSLAGLSGGKSSSRPTASGPTAAASSRSVISWLCQVLWGLVRNPNRSRWMMDSSPKANAFNPAAATPDRWVWVVLQEWVVAILTLQQQQQDPEGSPEEPPPEQEKHGNTVVVSGCCAPGLPSLPPPSSSSSTTTTTFRPTSRSAADTGRESLSHDRRTSYESRAPPPSLKPSWQFFSSSVVCHILREEIMAPLRSDTPHSHHRPPPLDAEEASSPLHSFALSYAHYRPTLKSLEERYACKSRDEILLWLCFFLQSQPGYRSLLHVTPPMSNSSWYHQQEAARVWELWMHTIIGSTSRRGMKEKSKEEPKGLRDGPEDGGTVLCSLSSTQTVLLLERVLHAL